MGAANLDSKSKNLLTFFLNEIEMKSHERHSRLSITYRPKPIN